MMQIEALNQIFDIDKKETINKLEQIKQELEFLISSKKLHAVAIQELEKIVSKVNKTLIRANATGVTDYQAMLAKSQELYAAGKLLSKFTEHHQEFYKQELLTQIRLAAQQIEGFGKYYEIHSLVKSKPAAKASNEELLKLTTLLTEFAEEHWETHPEEVAQLGMYAQQLVKLKQDSDQSTIDKWLSSPKFNRVIELNNLWLRDGIKFSEESYVAFMQAQERFIESALLARRRVEEKKIEQDVENTITKMDAWFEEYNENEMYETSLLLEELFGSDSLT